jgi:hypothetical protein
MHFVDSVYLSLLLATGKLAAAVKAHHRCTGLGGELTSVTNRLQMGRKGRQDAVEIPAEVLTKCKTLQQGPAQPK